jgi:FdhE protein
VSRLLRKLFGQAAPLPPEVETALAELTSLARDRPALALHAETIASVVRVVYRDAPPVEPQTLDEAAANAKLDAGVPLLRNERLMLDGRVLGRLLQEVCQVVAGVHGDMAVKAVADAVRAGQLDAAALAQQILAGQPDAVATAAASLDLDPALTATLLRLTLFPSMALLAESLALHCQQTAWPHGYCPICGGRPLLGEYRGLEQTRVLRCSLCGHGWEFPRLACPYCGCNDHHQLGYFHVEGEEGQYRATTCDACKGYVKMLATLQALTSPQLLAADVATLHLDLAAAERGLGS